MGAFAEVNNATKSKAKKIFHLFEHLNILKVTCWDLLVTKDDHFLKLCHEGQLGQPVSDEKV